MSKSKEQNSVGDLVMAKYGEEFKEKRERASRRRLERSHSTSISLCSFDQNPNSAVTSYVSGSTLNTSGKSTSLDIYNLSDMMSYQNPTEASTMSASLDIYNISEMMSYQNPTEAVKSTSLDFNNLSEMMSYHNPTEASRVNTHTYDEPIYEDVNKISFSNILPIILRREISVLQNIRLQLLKAINFANERSDFGIERIEAEKLLLLRTLEIELLKEELESEMFYTNLDDVLKIGIVNISNIRLKLNEPAVKGRSKVDYYVCILTYGSHIFASDVAESDSLGNIDFPINHTYSNLLPEFVIDIKIYSMTIKIEQLTKLNSFLCHGKKASSRSDCFPIRNSLFKPFVSHELKINQLGRPLEIHFRDVYTTGKLLADVTPSISNIPLNYCDWFNIRRGNTVFWNRQWCMLQGTTLKYWNYPVDDESVDPVRTIDLKACVSVRLPSESECLRKKTFRIENEDVYYFSAESRYVFDCWFNDLRGVVAVINVWRAHGCSV